jgi:hypothetical protein
VGSGSGNKPSSPLDKGVIAGIAIGAVASAVLILMGAWWTLSRTRGKQSSETDTPQNQRPVEADSKPIAMALREADSGQIHEISGGQPVEPVFELGVPPSR